MSSSADPICLDNLDGTRERAGMLEAVVEHFPGGIALFDHTMRMVVCNELLKTMLEYPPALFENGPPSIECLFTFNANRGEYGPGDPAELIASRLSLVRERRAHVYERTRPNGTVLEVRGAPLREGGFVTTYFDVTDRRRAHDMAAHLAHHDGLTGLPNRRLFLDRLRSVVEQGSSAKTFAVHYLDLDGFKPVNDTWGHGAGDALLAAVGRRLRNTVREKDTVARLGGDEFGILQVGIEGDGDAVALAKRLLDRVEKPYGIDGTVHRIGLSIGIAIAGLHGTSAEELLGSADAALYASKAAGRGRFTLSCASSPTPLKRPVGLKRS